MTTILVQGVNKIDELKLIKGSIEMKHYNFLIFYFLLATNSFSQSSEIFDESYFIHSLSDLLVNKIDSIKIYSKTESTGDNPKQTLSYDIRIEQNSLTVKKTSTVFSMLPNGIGTNSIQIFYLGNNFEIDSIHTQGVQDGIFLANIIDKKIIEYEKGAVKSVTVIENNFLDTTITNFYYSENLVYKVDIMKRKNRTAESKATNETIYIKYYREGELLQEIKE